MFDKNKFQEYLDNYCSLAGKKTLSKYNKRFGNMEHSYWSRVVRFYKSIEKGIFIDLDKFLELSNKEFSMNCDSKVKKLRKVKPKKSTSLECKVNRKKKKEDSKIKYKNYLESLGWKLKRASYIRKCNGKCGICREIFLDTHLHLHHHTYERVGKELDKDLVIVCNVCHENIHWKNGKKTPMNEKSLRYRFNELCLPY